MLQIIKQFFYKNSNDTNRLAWVSAKLKQIPGGRRILDAGAGELRFKPFCSHLDYVSQDFGQYEGNGDGKGLQTVTWDTRQIDLVCDITSIPQPDASFDVILCTEVLEHVPEPTKALDEFARLLKPGGKVILTAPFASLVHFAPYHFSSGFSRYWYEHHLTKRGFDIAELTPNGDWFSFCQQDIMSLGSFAKKYGDWAWPIAYCVGIFGALYFKIRTGKAADDLACFSWQCVAVKKSVR
jgi:SAM-dependent methyltransferase